MKLTVNSNEIYEYLKENGGKVSTAELSAKFGYTARQISGYVLGLTNKKLATREASVDAEGNKTTYVVLVPDYEKVFAALPEREEKKAKKAD